MGAGICKEILKIEWKVLSVQHGLDGALGGKAAKAVTRATTNEVEPLGPVVEREANGCVEAH
ncbi:hypothetical protein CRG98_048109 [Punica granatum]|uniref:Uncharacterized protein n=1 Tax=Punica granatum TaxID=22663 RepID=A0A2I0HIH0_PUNGR|nr:hypothetical protein CRG98_048109 [Punica granatum]